MSSTKNYRVGNIVKSIKFNTPITLTLADFWEAYEHAEGAADSDWFDTHVEPLTLTEEWMLKFGLEKEKDVVGVQWKLKGFYISEYSIRPLRLTLRFSQKKAIEYVHQLQNIFNSLTGEELTIK